MMTMKERVISLLRSVNRPGMDKVIDSLESRGYFDAKCYGHHRYKGGMSAHALEVYDYMIGVSVATVDEYNDKIMMLCKGMIELSAFAE